MDLIQTIRMPAATQTAPLSAPVSAPVETSAPAAIETKADKVEISSASEKKQPPNIGRWRLFFNRLTQEQINQVNETRMLPEKAKFERGLAGYVVANNWCNVFEGTPVLPAGYELKRGLLGFTKVRPIGTKGLFIRKTPEEKAAKLEAKAEAKAEKAQAKAEKQAESAK